MTIFSSRPPHGQRAYDPLLVVMLVAVVLAVGSSLALRLAVGGLGPKSAQASQVLDPDQIPPIESHHSLIPPR